MAKYKGTKRPTRDELILEDMGERLVEAYQEEVELQLEVWNWDESVTGKIVKLDSRTKLVHVERDGKLTKVPFMDIMEINNAN